MTSKPKRILFGVLATIAVVVALDSIYLRGYRHGDRDAFASAFGQDTTFAASL